MGNGAVRCWGLASSGQLGYGNTFIVGDYEVPASAGDVLVGGVATQVEAGFVHTCVLLDSGAVRCWGSAAWGQLGYGSVEYIGDDEPPASVGNVVVGAPVIRLSAGNSHTCALLDAGAVRCWGGASYGELGYGNIDNIGDDETPESAGNVNVGGNVVQIATGAYHT
jgi:alpha-tubulin suppressor-like RCC1 family protein